MTERPKALTCVWGMRRGQWGHYVRALGDGIQIVWADRSVLTISRTDARLLAKRINQCLDETRKP